LAIRCSSFLISHAPGEGSGAKMGGTYDYKSDALGIAWRNVFAIFSSVALLGQIKDFNVVTWQQDFANWIDAFRAFTQPIATYLFGWIALYFHFGFPAWMKDYIIVGLITAGASSRMTIAYGIKKWSILSTLQFIVVSMAAWPIIVIYIIFKYLLMDISNEEKRLFGIFTSVFAYFLLAIAINYAFVAGGAKIGG
jgi:hypothetical protein